MILLIEGLLIFLLLFRIYCIVSNVIDLWAHVSWHDIWGMELIVSQIKYLVFLLILLESLRCSIYVIILFLLINLLPIIMTCLIGVSNKTVSDWLVWLIKSSNDWCVLTTSIMNGPYNRMLRLLWSLWCLFTQKVHTVFLYIVSNFLHIETRSIYRIRNLRMILLKFEAFCSIF